MEPEAIVYAPVRIAMLPIGAYKPQWFMSPIHISPEEAAKIHLELKAEASIAMHFGTFALADDGQDDPIQDLEKARIKHHGIQSQEFMILKEGSFYEIRQKGIGVSPETVTFDLESGLDHRKSISTTTERLSNKAFHHAGKPFHHYWNDSGKVLKGES